MHTSVCLSVCLSVCTYIYVEREIQRERERERKSKSESESEERERQRERVVERGRDLSDNDFAMVIRHGDITPEMSYHHNKVVIMNIAVIFKLAGPGANGLTFDK
jgi:hypothetical protein